MAAATKDRTGHLHKLLLEQSEAPVAASTTVFLGTLVSFNASGYLVPAADAAAQANKAIYLAIEKCINSTATNGAKSCMIMTRGIALLPKGSLVQADVGKIVHASDDSTLALTSTNGREVGRLIAIEGSLAVVQIG
jgi:predicted RecA/RadA family phage recombinase